MEPLAKARAHYGALAARMMTITSLDEARVLIAAEGEKERMPVDVRVTSVTIGGVPCERLSPKGALPGVIVVVHGGGFMGGCIASHRSYAANVAAAARRDVVIVEYRLAPEHAFPAAIEDVTAVVRDLIKADPALPYMLCGDSAGGGLALSVVKNLQNSGARLPSALILIGPWVDFAATADSFTRNAKIDPMVSAAALQNSAVVYLNGQDPRHPLLAPLEHGIAGFPPMLIQVGDAEGLLDDSKALDARARKDGVDTMLQVWPDMMHTWHRYAEYLPAAQEALAAIGKFADAHMTSRK